MKKQLISWLALATGVAGFGLSWWFYTDGVNFSNMVTPHHPAAILLLILSVAALAAFFLLGRHLPRQIPFEKVLPASIFRAIGSFIGAVGIAISCVQSASFSDFLGILTLILGVLAAICLLFAGSQRLFGMLPHYLFYGLITLFFIVMSLNRCRQWGSQTQVLLYVFSLFAQIFLLLTAYQYAALCTGAKNVRGFVFCSHAAIFFCCVAFPAEFDLFYLASALWLALDAAFFRIPQINTKE